MRVTLSFFSTMAAVALALPTATESSGNIPANVPDFVVRHAPLLYLHSQEEYFPSDLAAHISHTTPKVGLNNLPANTNLPELSLDNLNILNNYGNAGVDIFLTAKDDVTTNPKWLEGIKPDANGVVANAKTGTIIVVDKGNGVVDAFYVYFYSFNWGGSYLGQIVGNHVGDWEHIAVRFINETPKQIWYSQHSSGQAFNYDIVRKDASGLRPLGFAGNGSHAAYAIDGVHDHTAQLPIHGATPGIINDWTDYGHVYDLTQSAYWYKWAPSSANSSIPTAVSSPSSTSSSPSSASAFSSSAPASVTPSSTATPLARRSDKIVVLKRDTDPAKTDPGTFTPYNPGDPVGYLYFKGLWGDQQYPNSDKRQKSFLNLFYTWNSGPSGPLFKELARKNIWAGGKEQPVWPFLVAKA